MIRFKHPPRFQYQFFAVRVQAAKVRAGFA